MTLIQWFYLFKAIVISLVILVIIAVLALTISYIIVKITHRKDKDDTTNKTL